MEISRADALKEVARILDDLTGAVARVDEENFIGCVIACDKLRSEACGGVDVISRLGLISVDDRVDAIEKIGKILSVKYAEFVVSHK